MVSQPYWQHTDCTSTKMTTTLHVWILPTPIWLTSMMANTSIEKHCLFQVGHFIKAHFTLLITAFQLQLNSSCSSYILMFQTMTYGPKKANNSVDFVSQDMIISHPVITISCNIIRIVQRLVLTSRCLIAAIVLLLSIHSRGTMQHLVLLPPTEWQTVRKPSQACSLARQAPFIFSVYLQMVSGGCVDTELCKSSCLRCGLTRSMCGLGGFFEVSGTLPVQTAETRVALPLQGPFSHIARLGVCSLQQSL